MHRTNLSIVFVCMFALGVTSVAQAKKKEVMKVAENTTEDVMKEATATVEAMATEAVTASADPMKQQMDAMMAKWQEYSTPTDNHKVLESMVGNWDHAVKGWMAPEGQPEESTGTTETKWIMGGRYIQSMAQGTSMNMPFEGMGITGYDNANKNYVSFWIDNMGTGVMTSTSTYDVATKTFTEAGEHSCPMESDGHKNFRGVIKIIDNDHYTYEMFSSGMNGGEEFRTMEITYTRKK